MRLAAEEKKQKKKIHEDLGKLKHPPKQGRTTVKPFNLRCYRRKEEKNRSDCPDIGEKRNTLASRKFVIQTFQAQKSNQLNQNLHIEDVDQDSLPIVEEMTNPDNDDKADEAPSDEYERKEQIDSAVSGLPLTPIKLFDVSVAVDSQTTVKITVTDHDDPWALSRQF